MAAASWSPVWSERSVEEERFVWRSSSCPVWASGTVGQALLRAPPRFFAVCGQPPFPAGGLFRFACWCWPGFGAPGWLRRFLLFLFGRRRSCRTSGQRLAFPGPSASLPSAPAVGFLRPWSWSPSRTSLGTRLSRLVRAAGPAGSRAPLRQVFLVPPGVGLRVGRPVLASRPPTFLRCVWAAPLSCRGSFLLRLLVLAGGWGPWLVATLSSLPLRWAGFAGPFGCVSLGCFCSNNNNNNTHTHTHTHTH